MSLNVDDASAASPSEPAAAGAWWSGWIAALTIGVCGLTPVIAYIGNQGFAPLIALAGLGCVPLLFRSRRPNLGVAILAVLLVWAVVSMLWSRAAPAHPDFSRYKAVEQLTALKLAPQLAFYGAFVAGALALTRRAGARATLVLALGLAAVAVLFLVEAVSKAQIYLWFRQAVGQATRPDWAMRDVARVAYVLSLLFWPVALRFEQAGLRPVVYGLIVAILVGSYLLNADAPFAALAVSSLVFAAVYAFGRRALVALLAGVVLYFVATPLLVHLVDKGTWLHPAADDLRLQSWQARLDIWRFAAARILERPFWGWGLDASRTFSPAIPLHTHNAAVQLWLELGAVGAGLAGLFWAWVVLQIDRVEDLDRPLAAASAAAASAYLTIGALSFGIWQEWWLALGALTAAACIALARARQPDPAGA